MIQQSKKKASPCKISLKTEKGTGHGKKAGDKKNQYELDEPTEEELEATETEEMGEDDSILLTPPFPNESDDFSAHILVKVQDCDPAAV